MGTKERKSSHLNDTLVESVLLKSLEVASNRVKVYSVLILIGLHITDAIFYIDKDNISYCQLDLGRPSVKEAQQSGYLQVTTF